MTARREVGTRSLPAPAKLALLATLYVAQGLPFGFFTQTLPAVMRKQGYRLAEISFSALLTLPWAIKFLWAPLVDRYPTPTPQVRARRKRWILSAQLAAACTFGALALHGSLTELRPLFAAFAFLNFISATQDIGTDALAVDMLTPQERGYANGVQVAGYRAGMVLGGGVLLVVLDRVGARGAFALLAGASLLLAIPLLLVTESQPTSAVVESSASHATPTHFISLPGAANILVVVMTYKVAESLAAGVLRPFLVDQGFSLAEIGRVSGIAGSGGGLVGALFGGTLASRLGVKRAMIGAGLFQTLTLFVFAFATAIPISHDRLAGIFFAEALASSMATATLFTVMMDWSRPLVGATDYTVQASAVVISTGLASLVSGAVAMRVGYVAHFVGCGAFGIFSLFVLVSAAPWNARLTDKRTASRP